MRLDHLLSRVPIGLLRQTDLLKPEQASDTCSVQDSLAVARRYKEGQVSCHYSVVKGPSDWACSSVG